MALTKREREILGFVSKGQSAREIAAALAIHKRTVDFHMANIFADLKVHNKIQALNKARQLGVLPETQEAR